MIQSNLSICKECLLIVLQFLVSIRTSSDDLELTSNMFSVVLIEAILAPNFVRSAHQTIFPTVEGPVGNLIT